MKFYLEVTELTAHADSESENFKPDQPFQTVEEAKAEVVKTYQSRDVTIYQCKDDILSPILYHDRYEIVWKPVHDSHS